MLISTCPSSPFAIAATKSRDRKREPGAREAQTEGRMAKRVLVLLGTKKGAFILESDANRRSWELSGPFCETWPLNRVIADPSTNTIYATGGNEWFGPAVWKSTDLGKTWTHSSQGLAYAEGEQPIKAGWSLAPAENGVLYAGVEPAGLFRSDDGGETWEHVAGLRYHP